MKQISGIILMFVFSGMIMAGNCKKSSSPTEPQLTVDTNPAVNSNQAPAPGPDFPLAVTITSTMPSGGVKIDVSAKQDIAGSVNFYSELRNSTTATNNFTITGSPRSVTLRVTIIVTSLSNSSNTWTGTYTYSRK